MSCEVKCCEGCTTYPPELKVGKVLFTKDGRKTGNAVIVSLHYSEVSGQMRYTCVTDFGSEIILSFQQIHNQFYVEESTHDGVCLTKRLLKQINMLSNSFSGEDNCSI